MWAHGTASLIRPATISQAGVEIAIPSVVELLLEAAFTATARTGTALFVDPPAVSVGFYGEHWFMERSGGCDHPWPPCSAGAPAAVSPRSPAAWVSEAA